VLCLVGVFLLEISVVLKLFLFFYRNLIIFLTKLILEGLLNAFRVKIRLFIRKLLKILFFFKLSRLYLGRVDDFYIVSITKLFIVIEIAFE